MTEPMTEPTTEPMTEPTTASMAAMATSNWASTIASESGRQLYRLLPEVYRTRDNGDLAGYLDACGELLDRIRRTIDQRLADSFPDRPEGRPAAQEWLLPYFAQLLDARLFSPLVDGRREEVTRAVAWRQGKGTRSTVEEIVRAVAQSPAEIHEGWRRVAVTPRIGLPHEPAFGQPVVTPDLSRSLGLWDTHRDRSRRTADTRSPGRVHGRFHPRRLLLHVPPPLGFFPADQIRLPWGDRHLAEHRDHLRDEVGEDGVRRIFRPLEGLAGLEGLGESRAVTVTTRPPTFSETAVEISDLNFLDSVIFSPPDGGTLKLRGVAAQRLQVRNDPLSSAPFVLDARDCLFGSLEVDGFAQLEYCTVLGKASSFTLAASDCIFAGELQIGFPASSCVRHSRIPVETTFPVSLLRRSAITTARPAFLDFAICDGEGVLRRSSEFGASGCGVLHPAAPEAICSGAEDGGEMGAYHRERHCLQRTAVLEKLRDFLPVGIEAVLVLDRCLLPPRPSVEPESA